MHSTPQHRSHMAQCSPNLCLQLSRDGWNKVRGRGQGSDLAPPSDDTGQRCLGRNVVVASRSLFLRVEASRPLPNLSLSESCPRGGGELRKRAREGDLLQPDGTQEIKWRTRLKERVKAKEATATRRLCERRRRSWARGVCVVRLAGVGIRYLQIAFRSQRRRQ